MAGLDFLPKFAAEKEQIDTTCMNNKYKYYLISGPVMALGLMLGTAIGASIGNIKIGVSFGLLFGTVFSALTILLTVYRQKKK